MSIHADAYCAEPPSKATTNLIYIGNGDEDEEDVNDLWRNLDSFVHAMW